jgi:Tol biopolymer transport system component
MKIPRGLLALLCAGMMLVGPGLTGGATLAQSDTLDVKGRLVQGTADGPPLPEVLPVILMVVNADHQLVANYTVYSGPGNIYHFTGVVRAPGHSYQVIVNYADVTQRAQSRPIAGDEKQVRVDLTLYEQTTDRTSVAVLEGVVAWSYSRTSPDVLTVWFSLTLLNAGDRIVTSSAAGSSQYFGSAPIELPAGAFDIQAAHSEEQPNYIIESPSGIPTVRDSAPLFPRQPHVTTFVYSIPYEGSAMLQHRFSDTLWNVVILVPNDTVQFQSDQFEVEGAWRYHRVDGETLPLAEDAVVDPSTDFSLIKEYRLLAPLPPETPLTITLTGMPTHFGEMIAARDADITMLPPGLINGTLLFNLMQPGNAEIQTIRLDDGQISTLASSPDAELCPHWSPDGAQIIFMSKRDADPDIYGLTLADGKVTRLTNRPGDEWSPVWSPDGTQIVFEAGYAGNEDIYVMPASGGEARALTSDPSEDWNPVWSPDGTQIAFEATRDGNAEIYVMKADGSDPRNLTNNPAEEWLPAWSPDGSQIAFVSMRDGNANIYVMNPDGSGLHSLTDHPGDEYYPAWSPDGQWMTFTSNRTGAIEIYVMALDSGALYRVTDTGVDYAWLSWQPTSAP